MTNTRIAPNAIYPTEKGKTVINDTRSRDWGQSGIKGEQHAEHMRQMAGDSKAYYELIAGPKGSPETGGGTVPMNDVKVRGRTPYEGVRAMRETLGDSIPMMALIRSNAGAAMDDLPVDVVKSYIHQYYDAGMDVFRNFHAHNDARQFRHVYDAVREKGGHFQAAYSWAVNNDEPALYNPRSVVMFFHELLDMDIVPDSWVLKDPSGVLTPTMAELITLEVQNDPRLKKLNLPFGIHTHNQMGQAAATCLGAAQAGANFVDAGPSFNNVPAQPSMPTLFHMLDNAGIDVGFGTDRAAKLKALAGLTAADERAKKIAQSYAEGRRPRMEDVTVEDHGIAGGQSSIAYGEMVTAGLMTKEEAETGVPIFTKYPELKELIRRIRADAGAVCQVTPAADRYFREGVRLLLACKSLRGEPEKFYAKAAEIAKANFNPSYAHILTGAAGTTAQEINPELQQQAVYERAKATAATLGLGELDDHSLRSLVTGLYEFTKPVRKIQRMEILLEQITGYDEMVKKASSTLAPGTPEARIAELYRTHIQLIEQKLAVAAAAAPGLPKTLDEVIARAGAEVRELSDLYLTLDDALSSEDYEKLQYGALSAKYFESQFRSLVPEKLKAQPLAVQQKLLAAASVTTVVASDAMEPGLTKARQSLIAKSQSSRFPLPLDEQGFAEAVTVEGMFGSINVPIVGESKPRNIVSYLFANRGDPEKWHVPEDAALKASEAKRVSEGHVMTRFQLEVSTKVTPEEVFKTVQGLIRKGANPAGGRKDELDPKKLLHGIVVGQPWQNGHIDKHVIDIAVAVDRSTRKVGQFGVVSNGLVVHRLAQQVAEVLKGELHRSQTAQLAERHDNAPKGQIAV